MRHARRTLGLAALLASSAATAAEYNRIYLVPAIKECPGPSSCVPREFESAYTFDSIILMSPATKYAPSGKPALILKIRGVRDPSGIPVNGNLTLRILPVRVSLPGLGTFPDDSPLTQVAPLRIPLRNGNNARFPYYTPLVPNGLIANGGGVEILDPDGNRLAVTGSQSRP
jgi:hypothetical protein